MLIVCHAEHPAQREYPGLRRWGRLQQEMDLEFSALLVSSLYGDSLVVTYSHASNHEPSACLESRGIDHPIENTERRVTKLCDCLEHSKTRREWD